MAYGRSLTIVNSPAQAIHPVMLLIDLRSLLAHTHHPSSPPAPPSPRSTYSARLISQFRWPMAGRKPSAILSIPSQKDQVLPSFHHALGGSEIVSLAWNWELRIVFLFWQRIRKSGKAMMSNAIPCENKPFSTHHPLTHSSQSPNA